MPWWGILALFALGIIIPTALFLVYCIVSSSERKSASVIYSIMRYGFYGILGLICLLGIISVLRSCTSDPYEAGYADGYEAGIEEGIDRVMNDPGAYFD